MKTYALAVCFATLLCAAITSGFLVYNIIKIANPELTINPLSFRMYESNEAYREMHAVSTSSIALSGPTIMNSDGSIMNAPVTERRNEKELSDEEVEKRRAEGRLQVLESHVFRARQGLLLQVIILSICVMLYLLHWRLAKRYEVGAA